MHINPIVNTDDPVQKYIEMYKNHPSILEIHEEGILQESISETRLHRRINIANHTKAYQRY